MKTNIITVLGTLAGIYIGFTIHLHFHPEKQVTPAVTLQVAPEVDPEVDEIPIIEPEPMIDPFPKDFGPTQKELPTYLLIGKSIETADGIIGIRPGTVLTLEGLHKYRTPEGHSIVASDDEVTTDPSKIKVATILPPPPEVVVQTERPKPTPSTPQPVVRTQQAPNRLNQGSYDKKVHGVKITPDMEPPRKK